MIKKTKIKLQDEFVRLSGAYDSQLTYPAYTRDILAEIVRLTGITTDANIQLVNDQVAKKLEKTSYREALVTWRNYQEALLDLIVMGSLILSS